MTELNTLPSETKQATQKSRLALRIHSSNGLHREVRIEKPRFAIGSGPRCQLRLTDCGLKQLHLLIVSKGKEILVRRWSGKSLLNGTQFVDAPFSIGDRLTVGEVELELIVMEDSSTAYRGEFDTETTKHNMFCDLPPSRLTPKTYFPAVDNVSPAKPFAGESKIESQPLHSKAAEQVFHQLILSNELNRGRARTFLASLRDKKRLLGNLELRIQELETLHGELENREISKQDELTQQNFNSAIAIDVQTSKSVPTPEEDNAACEPKTHKESRGDLTSYECVTGKDEEQQEHEEYQSAENRIQSGAKFVNETDTGGDKPSDNHTNSFINEQETANSFEISAEASKASNDLNIQNEISGEAKGYWGIGSTDNLDAELLGVGMSKRQVSSQAADLPSKNQLENYEQVSPTEASFEETSEVVDAPTAKAAEKDYEQTEQLSGKDLPGADAPESGITDSVLAHLQDLSIWKEDSEIPNNPATNEVAACEEVSSAVYADELQKDNEPDVAEHDQVEQTEDGLLKHAVEESPNELFSKHPTALSEAKAIEESDKEVPETKLQTESFIDRYADMFDDDEATDPQGDSGLSTIVPPANDIVLPTDDSAPSTDPDDSEDSIDQYMEQLMHRIRGETPASLSAAPAAKTPAVPTEPTKLESTPAPKAEVAEPLDPISLEELKNNGPLPEQATDMKALRELANQSARRAINVHASRKRRDNATGRVVISTIATISSIYLLLTSPAMLSLQFLGGCVSLVIAVCWGVNITGSLLRAENAQKKTLKTKETPITTPALPIDGTMEPASQSGSSIQYT